MLTHAALNRAAQVVEAISEAGCPLVVHVDARVGAAYDTFRARLDGLPDVSLAPRLECEWGTWALVQASRDGAETLLFIITKPPAPSLFLHAPSKYT